MAGGSKKVLVVLGEGFGDAEAAALVSALRWAGYRDGLPGIDVIVSGFRPVARRAR